MITSKVYKLTDIPLKGIVTSIRRLYTVIGDSEDIILHLTRAQLNEIEKTAPQLLKKDIFKILHYTFCLIKDI